MPSSESHDRPFVETPSLNASLERRLLRAIVASGLERTPQAAYLKLSAHYIGAWATPACWASDHLADDGEIFPGSLADRYFDYALYADDQIEAGAVEMLELDGVVHVFEGSGESP